MPQRRAARSKEVSSRHSGQRWPRNSHPFRPSVPEGNPGVPIDALTEMTTQVLDLVFGEQGAIGEADGVLGRASQRAIAAEQRRLGWNVDGRAGRKLLEALGVEPQ